MIRIDSNRSVHVQLLRLHRSLTFEIYAHAFYTLEANYQIALQTVCVFVFRICKINRISYDMACIYLLADNVNLKGIYLIALCVRVFFIIIRHNRCIHIQNVRLFSRTKSVYIIVYSETLITIFCLKVGRT